MLVSSLDAPDLNNDEDNYDDNDDDTVSAASTATTTLSRGLSPHLNLSLVMGIWWE